MAHLYLEQPSQALSALQDANDLMEQVLSLSLKSIKVAAATHTDDTSTVQTTYISTVATFKRCLEDDLVGGGRVNNGTFQIIATIMENHGQAVPSLETHLLAGTS
jgi:hypothetical protein